MGSWSLNEIDLLPRLIDDLSDDSDQHFESFFKFTNRFNVSIDCAHRYVFLYAIFQLFLLLDRYTIMIRKLLNLHLPFQIRFGRSLQHHQRLSHSQISNMLDSDTD